MKWMQFTEEIKHRGHMLFWCAKNKCWFEGNLVDDSEYGLCISLSETYTNLNYITHYMLIDTP